MRRIIGCAGLVLAGWLAFSAKPTPALPSAEFASVSNHSASLGDTNAASGILSGKAIEEIRVGDRVAAYNPEVSDSERAGWVEPDTTTWEVIDLEMPKRDGGLLEISLLRPKSWLADQQATVGSDVYLDSSELNAIGNAKVIAIRPCPTIESGSGRVVLGTFKHNSSDIVDIFVASQTSPIGTTSDHPFWSRDRQAFVPAAKLLPGEKLLSIDGATLQVTAVTPRATPSAVYNLEIQGEHAYAVSDAGVVVHNSCGDEWDDFHLPADNKGTWSGVRGDSNWTPHKPEDYGLQVGESVRFTKGFIDLNPHVWNNQRFKVSGMTGFHEDDMPLIWKQIAREKGWIHLKGRYEGKEQISRVKKWLSKNSVTPHHDAITGDVILVKSGKGGPHYIPHTGDAYRMRNNPN